MKWRPLQQLPAPTRGSARPNTARAALSNLARSSRRGIGRATRYVSRSRASIAALHLAAGEEGPERPIVASMVGMGARTHPTRAEENGGNYGDTLPFTLFSQKRGQALRFASVY